MTIKKSRKISLNKSRSINRKNRKNRKSKYKRKSKNNFKVSKRKSNKRSVMFGGADGESEDESDDKLLDEIFGKDFFSDEGNDIVLNTSEYKDSLEEGQEEENRRILEEEKELLKFYFEKTDGNPYKEYTFVDNEIMKTKPFEFMKLSGQQVATLRTIKEGFDMKYKPV
jgi:hypothetical protein